MYTHIYIYIYIYIRTHTQTCSSLQSQDQPWEGRLSHASPRTHPKYCPRACYGVLWLALRYARSSKRDIWKRPMQGKYVKEMHAMGFFDLLWGAPDCQKETYEKVLWKRRMKDEWSMKETYKRDLLKRTYHREVGGWGRVPFSRNFMKPTPRRKWYLTTGRRFH